MKRIKYFLSAILVFSLFTSMAFAAEAPLTAEDILEIQTTNEKIEQYIAENPLPRAGETKILDVPCYQQETDYWCGVACAQMVLDYCTGVKYPQSTLATLTCLLYTSDPRMKERKKYGLKAARRAPQFSKR